MFYYFSLTDINNYIYSIDMIRINFELNESIIDINDKFNHFLHVFSSDSGCQLKRFLNNSFGYKYLYNLIIDNTDEKCSFVIGLCLGSKQENKNKGFIEFNPNKCFKSKFFISYYERFKNLCYSFTVKRYDLAIDLPYKRDLVKLVRNFRCNYEFKYYDLKNGLTINRSFTEYQGIRNRNKFTKLYDKTKESNLDYDCTRIEFTFDRDEINFNNLPKFIYFNNYNLDLNSNNLVLLNLLLNSNDLNYYFKLLSYRKRKALEPYLNDYYVKLDYHNFLVIRDFVLSFEFSSYSHYV